VLFLLPSREKVRMRVIRIKALAFDTLTPTLSITRERGFCDTLLKGERTQYKDGELPRPVNRP